MVSIRSESERGRRSRSIDQLLLPILFRKGVPTTWVEKSNLYWRLFGVRLGLAKIWRSNGIVSGRGASNEIESGREASKGIVSGGGSFERNCK